MKRILALFTLIAFVAGASSFMTPAGDSSTVVKIKKGKFFINGSHINSGWGLGICKTALGEPDRVRDGYNKTHTYDSKSVVLFEPMKDKTPSGTVSEIQFYFYVPEPNNVTPNGQFGGSIKVDKLVVTKNLSAKTMLSKLKSWSKTDSYIEHSYRMASKGLYIYFQFNDNEDQLVKISVGPDKKGSK